LAGLAGHAEKANVRPESQPSSRPTRQGAKQNGPSKKAPPIVTHAETSAIIKPKASRDVGLTVRIEVNLPASGDQETYDRIFKSIRTNLIDAE
jgi:hypothetical protein